MCTHTYTHTHLDKVLRIRLENWVQYKVIQVSMLSGKMIVEIDKVFNVVVRTNVSNVLQGQFDTVYMYNKLYIHKLHVCKIERNI